MGDSKNGRGNDNSGRTRRKGMTSLSLGWLADRMRRAERIKSEIQSGSYQVDPKKVAASMVLEED